MYDNSAVDRLARNLRQFKAHTKTLENGDKLIKIEGGLYDLFSGIGWKNQSRFRVVRLKHSVSGARQLSLIQIGGISLSREYRDQLLHEVM